MPSVPSVEKLCAHVASLKSSSEIARPLLTRGLRAYIYIYIYIYRQDLAKLKLLCYVLSGSSKKGSVGEQ